MDIMKIGDYVYIDGIMQASSYPGSKPEKKIMNFNREANPLGRILTMSKNKPRGHAGYTYYIRLFAPNWGTMSFTGIKGYFRKATPAEIEKHLTWEARTQEEAQKGKEERKDVK